MRFSITPSLTRSLVLLWISHLLLDFFTGIWPMYKTIAQMDLAKAGLIAGVSGFIGEFLQVFFGYFCDRGHRKTILMLGLFLASMMLWITFMGGIVSSFFILMMLMLGSGSFHPAAVGFAGSLSVNNKSRSILFFASGGAIGLAISQIAFVHVLNSFQGQALIFFVPVAIVLFLLALYPFPKTYQPRTLSVKEFFQPIMKAKRALILLYLTQVANYTLYLAFIFLLPDLMAAKGCHKWLCMGGGHFTFILGSALLMTPAGFLCDRFGPKPVLLGVILGAISLLYAFLFSPSLSAFESVLFLGCLGGMMGTINPILVSWANRLVPESPSTVSAILMGFAWCLSNLGTLWAGLLSKSIHVDPITSTISWMGLLLAAAFLFAMQAPSAIPAAQKTA
ncbi:MAG: MFS transporter [Parachlamydiales bacterium]